MGTNEPPAHLRKQLALVFDRGAIPLTSLRHAGVIGPYADFSLPVAAPRCQVLIYRDNLKQARKPVSNAYIVPGGAPKRGEPWDLLLIDASRSNSVTPRTVGSVRPLLRPTSWIICSAAERQTYFPCHALQAVILTEGDHAVMVPPSTKLSFDKPLGDQMLILQAS